MSANLLISSLLFTIAVSQTTLQRHLLATQSINDFVDCSEDPCECPDLGTPQGDGCELQCAVDDAQCQGSNLTCRQSDDCNMMCITTGACADATLDGSGSGCVNAQCAGIDSCKAAFIAGGIDFFTADCSGQASCEDSTINGALSTGTLVRCNATDACKGTSAHIIGGICNFDVFCIGETACQDAVIDGSESVNVTLTCEGEGACIGDTELTCGVGACTLHCLGADNMCEDIIVNVGSATSFSCTGDCFSESIPDEFDTGEPVPDTCLDTTTPTRAPAPIEAPTAPTTFGPTREYDSSTTRTPRVVKTTTYAPDASKYDSMDSVDSLNVEVNVYLGGESKNKQKEYY